MNPEEKILKLLQNPHESLSVEIKDWLDPRTVEGKAKLIKAIIAMRNNDGGIFVIGIRNDGKSNPENFENVEEVFNVDDIQGLITRHSSESFEISIYFLERDNKKVVAITVPSGIKTPVAIKKPLVHAGRNIIDQDAIFVRSLDSNNTPSTTKIGYKDWPSMMERCFENREVDIGRFLRRHLINVKDLSIEEPEKSTSLSDVNKVLDEGLMRYKAVVEERQLSIPEHGAMEVAAILNGEIKQYSTNQDFINLILSNNPDYTGWPLWMDSRSFSDEKARPYVYMSFWESMIASFNKRINDDLDFWRISPKGQFYHYRGLQDDISGSRVSETRLKTLDFGLTILRVAEAILVIMAFAKSLELKEDSPISFEFRWSKLKGRVLSSWANPGRHISERKAYQDQVSSCVKVPINVAKTAVYNYAHEVTRNVFELFEGFKLSEKVTEDLVTRLLERKL